MPVKSPSFWSRFSGLFRKRSAGDGKARGLPAVGDDGLLLDPAEYPEPTAADAEAGSERSVNPLTRWTRREQTLVRLQEGYERVNQVVEEIQKHLAQQGERTERISSALEQLARTMGDLPGLGRQQAQTLEAIAGHIEAGNTRVHQLGEAVSELPKASRAQTETLNGIKRQLEVTGEQNLVTSQTMEKLSSAIGVLGELNATQVQALQQMNAKADDQTERLSQLVARQNRRFVMLFVVTIVLAVGAITAAILSLSLS
ncbi:MAG: hypothetical protein HY718_16810 [Planctomycetes bacterium]|nr:hypothetical protein [Planctomycetota bacterium]